MRWFLRSISYGRFFVSQKRCMRSFNGRNLTVDIGQTLEMLDYSIFWKMFCSLMRGHNYEC